jgi:integrase
MKKRTTKHIKWEELTELIKNMKRDGNRLHLLCTIQAMLGLRVGDVLNLKWKDLLSNTELKIIEGKTKKPRKLIVNRNLQEAVQVEFKKKFNRNKNEPIFLNKHKTSPISISYVNRELKKSFRSYGLEAEQISSHMLRKSFSYKILEDHDFSDKAIFLVSRLLNHSNINTTMRYLQLDEREADNIYKGLTI